MLMDSLIPIFERDIRKLKDEIGLYETDEQLWIVTGDTKNSGGNIALHLIGNLKHFIGAVIGETGFVRDRDAEFGTTAGTRAAIMSDIDETIAIVTTALGKLTDEDLTRDFPVQKWGDTRRTDLMLLHLFGHLSYHLGQINYHRRMTA